MIINQLMDKLSKLDDAFDGELGEATKEILRGYLGDNQPIHADWLLCQGFVKVNNWWTYEDVLFCDVDQLWYDDTLVSENPTREQVRLLIILVSSK